MWALAWCKDFNVRKVHQLCAVCSLIFAGSCITTSLSTGERHVRTQVMRCHLRKCLAQSGGLMWPSGAMAQWHPCTPTPCNHVRTTLSAGFCWRQQAAVANPGNALLQAGPPGGGAPSGFIRVQGGTFVDDDCNEFLLFGWNRCVYLSLPCTSAN